MEGKKKKEQKDGNSINACKLVEVLSNDESTFACVSCFERNSYETYNNILVFVKKYLKIPLYVIDILSIYNHDNIAKFVKDVFINFIKYIKRKKAFKSVLFLPYFDDWVVSIKESRNLNGFEGSNEESDKFSDGKNYEQNELSDSYKKYEREKKKKKHTRDVNMHIYNSIYYLKNKLLKKLNKKKFCVKLIGFHKTRGIFDLYKNLFDCKINISYFVNTRVPYYIHLNKDINKRLLKKKNLSIDKIYTYLSNKVDYLDSMNGNNVNLFKCFFTYYYNFQKGIIRKSRKNGHKKKLEIPNISNPYEHTNYEFLSNNFKLINCLINLNYFKYLRKYKYFLINKKKKTFAIFLFTQNDKHVLKRICKRLYTPFFIKEYVYTLLKRHTKLRDTFKSANARVEGDSAFPMCSKEDTQVQHFSIISNAENCNDFNDNKNNCCGRVKCFNMEPNKRVYTKQLGRHPQLLCQKHVRKRAKEEDLLAPIRKQFILKNIYQCDDNYNICNSQSRTLLRFYFSKIKLPNTCLIYGSSGAGKTTLLQFLVHIISSNYKDIFFDEKILNCTLDNKTEMNINNIHDRGGTNMSKENKHTSNNPVWGRRRYKHVSYMSFLMKKMNYREKKKLFFQFQNVCIIAFENHLLVNKTIGENSRYIKKIFTMALKNQPAVIIFDNIDLFLEKNNNYKYPADDQNEDVYKNIYILLIHYLRIYVNTSNKIKFFATCSVHPQFFKFSFLNLMQRMLFIS
ncbi:hypothetical protein, conserved [Plasmodium gonderi]|uniref:AAA+ ATPase domain-containing protein n=1 Tax=Plasmodium gonderi TaxID=77519 RepID=A0A1Y1JIY4_PLAGO|nr:hypothetical protein, conserved [Plasmodium gonderi]GAW82456.1 hypothetical protein, conserved [Plasmodium gonderi]